MARTSFNASNKNAKEELKRALAVLSALFIMGGAGFVVGDKLYAKNDDTSIVQVDFDIDKEAQAIYDKLEDATKERFTLQDIKNIMYIVSRQYDDITFANGMTDADKYEYLENLKFGLISILDDNTMEEVNIIAGNTEDFDQSLMSSEDYIFGEDTDAVIDEDRQVLTNLKEIAKKQVELEKNNASDKELKDNAAAFYNINEQAVNDKKMAKEVRWAIFEDVGAKAPLFAPYLTKEQQEEIDKNNQRIVENRLFDEVYDYLDLDPNALDCETKENTTEPFGNHYNSNDAARAKAYEKEQSENKTIDAGGASAGTVKSNSGSYTTTARTTTGVPKTNPENGNTVPQTSSHSEVTSRGGQQVGETSTKVVTDPALTTTERTTESTTAYEEPEYEWDDGIGDKAYKKEHLYQRALAALTASFATMGTVLVSKKYTDYASDKKVKKMK